MPTVPGTVQRAWETPMKKQMDIVGRAYICSCYFLKYFFPISHAGSAAKRAGILEQHSRVQRSLAKYPEWSIKPVPRNMASNLYHSVPGPAGSNSQGHLIIWWAGAQQQKALGKINKSGSILISVGCRRNPIPASVWRHKGQGTSPSKKGTWWRLGRGRVFVRWAGVHLGALVAGTETSSQAGMDTPDWIQNKEQFSGYVAASCWALWRVCSRSSLRSLKAPHCEKTCNVKWKQP